MLTLTVQHRSGDDLKALWEAVNKGWSSVTSGRPWKRIQQDWGVLGFARALELTYGDNGWHPHLHVVLVLEGSQTVDCVEALGEKIWPRWLKTLERRGFTAKREHGLDIRCSSDVSEFLANYFVKQLAIEATHGYAKEGRKGGRTPFQILADFFKTGELGDFERWRHYEQVSRGKKQLTWSKNLRQLAGLAAESTDEEIAEEEAGDEDLLAIPADEWQLVAAAQGELLLAAEREGIGGARRWLDERGVGWVVPELPRTPSD